jgi:hypothetical protein
VRDSLTQQAAAGAGIPDAGTRVTILVIVLFVLAVGALLVYVKMKEADQAIGRK